MPSPRLRKTLADYLVIAICPLLIMALVGSLSFFLLQLSYHGQHQDRLRWMLFWFTLASVLISRISIEQGPEQARVYGLFLGAATVALIIRLAGVNYAGFALLAFIWWCTSKLTWDCTLVDDWEDASGEGLLQVGGLEKAALEPAAEVDSPQGKAVKQPTWWERLTRTSVERKGKPHAPGIWIIYFSLLALPTFGIGQAFIPADNTTARDFAFHQLCIYVAAAFGLLLSTSFLGLRRYLRQRNVQMPVTIAGSWLLLGTLLAGGIILVCLLIPRPDGSFTLSTLVDKVSEEADKRASKYAMVPGEAAKGDGTRIGSGEGEPKGESKINGQADGQGKKQSDSGKAAENNSQKQSTPQSGTGTTGGNQNGQGQSGGNGQSAASGQQNLQTPPPTEKTWLGELVKWLIYGLIIAVVLYLLYRHRKAVMKTLRDLWQALKEIIASLFSWQRKPKTVAPAVTAVVEKPRPFEAFTNPFSSGMAQSLTREDLVTYTFNALEAWAYERDCRRVPDQTPLEFARELAEKTPEIGEQARRIAQLYTRIAYAEYRPTEENLGVAEDLWREMDAAPAVLPTAAPVSQG